MNRRSFIRQVALGVPAMLALPACGWPKEPQSKAAEEVVTAVAPTKKFEYVDFGDKNLWGFETTSSQVLLPDGIEPLTIGGKRVFPVFQSHTDALYARKMAVLIRHADLPRLEGLPFGRCYLNGFRVIGWNGVKWAVVEWSLDREHDHHYVELLEEAGKALAAA